MHMTIEKKDKIYRQIRRLSFQLQDVNLAFTLTLERQKKLQPNK